MPNMPRGDRIRELEMSVASQSTQHEAMNKTLSSLGQAHQEIVHKFEEARRELEKTIEVLKEKVSKLEQAQTKGSDRFWSFFALILAAVIGALSGSVAT